MKTGTKSISDRETFIKHSVLFNFLPEFLMSIISDNILSLFTRGIQAVRSG